MRAGEVPLAQAIYHTTDTPVIHYIEHSHDNTYPVVDENSTLIGVIRYPSLSSALFDRNVGSLVRAEDLAMPIDALLHPDDPASCALDLLNKDIDDCIPVVSREMPHKLLGVVRKNDMVHLLIRGHRG